MNRLMLLLLLMLVSHQAPGEDVTNVGNLQIMVSGIEDLQGGIMMAVHNKPDTYLSKDKNNNPYRAVMRQVTSSDNLVFTLEDMPVGTYAVAVFHDVNSNGELDSGLFGIPKEPYGFSNNVRTLGPPSYDEATFAFTPGNSSIEIRLK